MSSNFRFFKFATILGCISFVASMAMAQWGSAVMEQVTSGIDNDELGQSAIALDDVGTLHVVFDRGSGGDHNFFYTQKLLGETWSAPVAVGDHNAQLISPYLDVQESSGNAYVVYLHDGLLKLGLRDTGTWEYYDLQTPYLEQLFDPALAVDEDGYAHVAFVVYHAGEYHIGYGYWDGPGSTDFHFQYLRQTQLGAFGSGASPDICVRSDGSVAICYRGGGYLNYQVDVIENFALGGSSWDIQTISLPDYQCYPGSIKSTPGDDLHLAFNGNMGFGFPNDLFYTNKPEGAYSWYPPVEVGGTLGGGDVKLAVEDNDNAHIVCMETSGNFYTGNIIYTTNQSGSWQSQYLLQGNNKYSPSLVMDAQGNGSLAFQQEVTYTDNDVYCYGYVAPITQPDMVVTLSYNSGSPVPAGGGAINFDVWLENNETFPVNFDLWIEIPPQVTPPSVPNRNLTFPGGFIIMRPDMNWPIPASWPAGNYTMDWYIGDMSTWTAWASDSFPFEKSATDDGSGFTLWEIDGDPLDQLFEGIDFGATVVSEFALLGSYPNPFNPSATISYTLDNSDLVKLSVYDLSGRQVATLVDGYRDAGAHEVNFDASGLSSGIYIYRLEAGDFTASGKMVLMK